MTTESVVFHNWTDEDFAHRWDNQLFSFKAKSSTRLPSGLAEHFAKHLATRELNRQMLDLGQTLHRKEFETKALSEPMVAESPIKADIDVLNEQPEAEPKKKMGRPKKVVEEDFEGLKE